MSDPRSWNPWHGCRKYSEGCDHCYMFYLDGMHRVETSCMEVRKTQSFDLPVQRDGYGDYRIPSGFELSVNMTSDTFIEEADAWRDEMWRMIRERPDVIFYLLTKRVHRIPECLPDDWGDGYDNVKLNITCENQRAFDERWPIFRDIPAKHKGINLAPLIGPVDITPALESGQMEHIGVNGEGYGSERPCRYEWLEQISEACARYRVNLAVGPVGNVFYRNGFPYLFKTIKEQNDYAYRTHLSRFYGRVKVDLYDPIDGHPLNGSEIIEPMFNLDRCRRCPQMEFCMGCFDCGNCKDVKRISFDEMVELRSKD